MISPYKTGHHCPIDLGGSSEGKKRNARKLAAICEVRVPDSRIAKHEERRKIGRGIATDGGRKRRWSENGEGGGKTFFFKSTLKSWKAKWMDHPCAFCLYLLLTLSFGVWCWTTSKAVHEEMTSSEAAYSTWQPGSGIRLFLLYFSRQLRNWLIDCSLDRQNWL